MTGAIPLIGDYRPAEWLLWQANHAAPSVSAGDDNSFSMTPAPLSQAQFLASCLALSHQLPDARYAINLCEDRGLFLHAFAAVIVRGQTNLLPSSRVPGVVKEAAAMFADAYLICDAPFEDIGIPQFYLRQDRLSASIGAAAAPSAPANMEIQRRGTRRASASAGGNNSFSTTPAAVPEIPGTQTACIVFTSGSTGGPQPHLKSWRNLVTTAGLCAERFLGSISQTHVNIIATVPPQHMYGLELSVMLALTGAGATHAARPFFPEDVRAALASVPEPRLLVTTPVHLKSLAASTLEFPPIFKIISATAPLSRDLAQRAEQVLQTEVHEIYGCTEAGSMCTRRTVDGERWQPYPGLQLLHHAGMTHVTGPHLDAPVATPDVVETHADGSITLLGRAGDMVKVGGKRASLTQLTGKLLAIPGVEDGVVFLPDSNDTAGVIEKELSPSALALGASEVRLAAVVVAPGLSEQQILSALALQVDPVFLPRPLHRVETLTRNALGKLPRAELLALIESRRA